MSEQIVLVVKYDNETELHVPDGTDVRIVDADAELEDPPVMLPRGKGFERLVDEACVRNYVEFFDDI